MSLSLAAERRRPLQGTDLHRQEPERKRVRRNLEAVPQEISPCHPPSKYTMDYWNMEQDWRKLDTPELFSPQIMKEKPNSVIFPDNETRAAAQPCPRCIAGESTAFVHGEMRMYSQTNLDLREKAEGIWIFNNIRQ
ncbi:uncharacterized protein C10orf143 homolog [Tiliqua scincoides]|uniref:uncharacterized protein C10orf143 homolog n=1 Tax=Tiliqua scincoides TaxID=71010 RepID=UPI0034618020